MIMANGTNRVLDELTKLIMDAAGVMQGVRGEMETAIRNQAERLLHSMDVVSREDFEAVREMTVKIHVENTMLAARIEMLEERLEEITSQMTPRTTKHKHKS